MNCLQVLSLFFAIVAVGFSTWSYILNKRSEKAHEIDKMIATIEVSMNNWGNFTCNLMYKYLGQKYHLKYKDFLNSKVVFPVGFQTLSAVYPGQPIEFINKKRMEFLEEFKQLVLKGKV